MPRESYDPNRERVFGEQRVTGIKLLSMTKKETPEGRFVRIGPQLSLILLVMSPDPCSPRYHCEADFSLKDMKDLGQDDSEEEGPRSPGKTKQEGEEVVETKKMKLDSRPNVCLAVQVFKSETDYYFGSNPSKQKMTTALHHTIFFLTLSSSKIVL